MFQNAELPEPDAIVKEVFEIESDEIINEETLNKIIDILKNSKCPNESLSNSLSNFTGFFEKTIILGKGGKYKRKILV